MVYGILNSILTPRVFFLQVCFGLLWIYKNRTAYTAYFEQKQSVPIVPTFRWCFALSTTLASNPPRPRSLISPGGDAMALKQSRSSRSPANFRMTCVVFDVTCMLDT